MSRILLVEDDAWLSELYGDILTRHGCTVHRAETANAALDILNKEAIDILILDMFLPHHNGVELLHEIASYTDTNTVPVIVLSSVYQHDFKMSEERWRHYGVVQYLYKPATKPQRLVAEVQKQLAKVAA